VFKVGNTLAAGMMKSPPEMGNVPSHWMVYFQVESCDGTVQRAQSLGAKTMVPPTAIPTVGRFAVLQDPQGAAFSILEPQRS
jgi:predicted enzyme related to lactoylglutathione lyase